MGKRDAVVVEEREIDHEDLHRSKKAKKPKKVAVEAVKSASEDEDLVEKKPKKSKKSKKEKVETVSSKDEDVVENRPKKAKKVAVEAVNSASEDEDSVEKKPKKSKKSKKERAEIVNSNSEDEEVVVKQSKKKRKKEEDLLVDDSASEGDLETFTVYVEGIPYETTNEDIWNLFSDCGMVVDVRVPRWNDSGKCRGYAHVDFEKKKHMLKAIETLNRFQMGARYITVVPAKDKAAPAGPKLKPGDIPDTCTTIFVKNLPYETDEDVVQESLANFGTVVNVRLAKWNHTGRLKGFGYVQFSSVSAVRAVVASTDPVVIGDRNVIVDADIQGKPKSSFRDASGRQWSKTEGKELHPGSSSRGRGSSSRGRGMSSRGRGRGSSSRGRS